MQGYLDDEPLRVARGLVRGASIRNIFGFSTLANTVYSPMWERTPEEYEYPTANTFMNIKSDNASDGSNVSFLVKGLDSNYSEISESVNLNGTANVTLTKLYYRINDVIGTANNALGTVTVRNANSGVTYAQVSQGVGKSQASIYTVPVGHCFYLNRIDAFCGTAAINNRYIFFRNYTKSPSGLVLNVAETTFLEQMHVNRHYPFKYDEKTDIQFQIKTSNGSQEVGIFGEGILVNESYTGGA